MRLGFPKTGTVDSGKPRRRRFSRISASRPAALDEDRAEVVDCVMELILALEDEPSVVFDREVPIPWRSALNLRFVAFMLAYLRGMCLKSKVKKRYLGSRV